MEDRPKSIKSGTRRRPATRLSMAAASSPTPGSMGASSKCGHDGCGSSGCSVRYVGPVSHLRDHHALHAANGVAHVWTAAVVSGLAVVLTGVIAYNAQAATPRRPAPPSADTRLLMERLDRMERAMHEMAQSCMGGGEDMPEDEQAEAGREHREYREPSADEQELLRKKRLMMEEAQRNAAAPRREPAAGGSAAASDSAPAGDAAAGGSAAAADSAAGSGN